MVHTSRYMYLKLINHSRDWMMEEDEEEISDDDADEMEGFTRGVDAESAGTTAERERQRATMAGNDQRRQRMAV